MPKMPRFRQIPSHRADKRKIKPTVIQDTKRDRRGRRPIFTLSNFGGFFDIMKKYPSTNRTTYGFTYEPKKQARMLKIRRGKK